MRMCFGAEAIKFVECGWLPGHGNKPAGEAESVTLQTPLGVRRKNS